MAKYREFFISIMVSEELKLQIPDPDDSPYKDGFITFSSFLVFGSIPLLGYILLPLLFAESLHPDHLLIIASVVTALSLFILGCFKSKFSTKKWYEAGLEFLLLGGLVALTSFFIGYGVSVLTEQTMRAESSKHLVSNLYVDNNETDLIVENPGNSFNP